MEPDERLYATLIAAAGSAGRLPLAFELRDEMRLERLVPGEVRHSPSQQCSSCCHRSPCGWLW